MKNQITKNHLEDAVLLLNAATCAASREGQYQLSGAYGGWNLHKREPSGGVSEPLGGGHRPKRELLAQIKAYTNGIREGYRLLKEAN